MDKIYELTFFLSLALLAIVIAVFVLAVSLLGRAIEGARKSAEEKVTDRKKLNTLEMNKIKKEVEEAEKQGVIPGGLKQKLGGLESRDRQFEKELREIGKEPGFLTVKGGVVCPCGSLVLSLAFSGLALYLYNAKIYVIDVAVWATGLIAIGYSAFRVYKSLSIVQRVAVSSEGEAEKRLARAVKVAMAELEEDKNPAIRLVWVDEQNKPLDDQSVIKIKAEKGNRVNFYIELVKEVDARNVNAWIQSSREFSFPGHVVAPLPNGDISLLVFSSSDIAKGIYSTGRFKIIAPPKKGEYIIFYTISAFLIFSTLLIRFDSGLKRVKVIVY